ncbi:MAG: putative transporter [Bacteroidales bacterium]|nr:putative transporter [Bacteroidales bacterium]
MSWFESLCSNYLSTANTILLYAIIISIGVFLGKFKIRGISLGITWVLFVGIFAGHLGFQIEPNTLTFIKDFGLILFVFCIGLQVGPSFFSSFKRGGIIFNILAMGIVFLNIIVALVLYYIDGSIELPMIVGVLFGAATNTPGLGAANEALNQINYTGDPISLGYACAYPLGIAGAIIAIIAVKYICRINIDKEEEYLKTHDKDGESLTVLQLEICNDAITAKPLKEITKLTQHHFICSRICHQDIISKPDADTILHQGDFIMVICKEEDIESITKFFGKKSDFNWINESLPMISRRILITKSDINGKKLKDLHLSNIYNVIVTRVNRSGVDLFADPNLELQIGDRIMVVGKKESIDHVAQLLGNELKKLDTPNIITIFVGIFLGILVGSIPLKFPGMPTPVKLGLAGGPLIIAILIGRFGHKLKLITYTTVSANLMLREIGIALFLASVGIDAGDSFLHTIIEGDGLLYVAYGVIITIIPIIIIGLLGRYVFHINYFSLAGLISGATTNPAALAFASQSANNDKPAVAYSTVYPLTMFLRIISGQIILLLLM